MSRKRIPLLIIGLDGASHSVLRPLAGRLPHLTQLLEQGASGVAKSVNPPATFPAWTSILTGAPPEAHGVRELLTRDAFDSPLRAASGQERRVPLIPEELARAGKRVACIGIPGLYPPPQVPGAWISGFDSPGADRALRQSVFPPSLYRELERTGHWRYATFNEQSVDLKFAHEALLADLESKRNLVMRLQRREPWDLFFVHLQASDTVCHHFWPTWDRQSPRAIGYAKSEAIPEIFGALDALVGELLHAHEGRVLLVSDHGFGGASDIAVYLNRVLADLGLLKFRDASMSPQIIGSVARAGAAHLPTSWTGRIMQSFPTAITGRLLRDARHPRIDFNRSVAFSDELDYSPSIWLRRPLTSDEQHQLYSAVLGLEDPRSGQSLVHKIHRREGHGASPDLVLEPRWPDGYRPSFLASKNPGAAVEVLDPGGPRGRGAGMPGVHHPDGVVALFGPEIEPVSVECTLPEIGASIPALMNTELDTHPDRVSPALALAVGLETRSAKPRPGSPTPSPRVSGASLARLRALGYL